MSAPRIHLQAVALLALLAVFPAGAMAQKVYINPSNQTWNAVCSGGNEAQYALINANKTEVILDAAGFNAKVDQDFYNAPYNANSWGAVIFVSIHSNAGGGHGTETLYKSTADKILAGDVQAGLLANLPYQSRGLKYRTDLHVLNATNMTVCLPEVVFHDCCVNSGWQGHPPSESAFLKSSSGQNAIADGLAEGICDYFDADCGGSVPTTGTLKGVVYVNPNMADRIPGATVTLNTGQSTTSDGVGYWEFELAPGTYTATASKAGYLSGSNTKAVTAGAEIWGSIGLSLCDCDDGNPCTNDSCTGGVCSHTNNTNNCNDGNACTSGDKCSGGVCQGTDISGTCDDGNPCTNDACNPASGCTHANNAAACDDGDACTSGDLCAGGTCSGEDISDTCEDGNPCTDDGCDALAGCVFVPNDNPCDDGNACTGPDICAGGLCAGADIASACDDLNPCTDDWCDPGVGCLFAANVAPCDDGDACTAGDLCVGAVCVGNDLSWTCNDGNPCTDDGCDSLAGCVFVPNELACDDGDACTLTDLCAAGLCVGSGAPACDDGNPCTDDSCAPASGCVHLPYAAPCDDGDVCTGVDICESGVCVGMDTSNVDCDDGNPCTTDGCDPISGCFHAACHGPCDDGDPCTAGDACQDGSCHGVPVGSDACDDGNPCTADQCASPTGCIHQPTAGPCDDGDTCTLGDHCAEGLCQGGAAKTCVDGNPCTDDSCSPQSGCTFTPNTAPCDDGDPCTAGDVCAGGTCGGADVDCDDGNPCTETACLDGECVVQSVQAGCCTVHEDCATPKEACDLEEHACISVTCLPCEDDGDCGVNGNQCLLLDGAMRCVIGCGGDPGSCPVDAPCTLGSRGGWVCLPAPGGCETPDPAVDSVVHGDAPAPEIFGGGDAVTIRGNSSGGCAMRVAPAGRYGIALLLLLALIFRMFSAPRHSEAEPGGRHD